MFCAECGGELKDSQRFCSQCGAAVAGASAPAETTSPLSVVPDREAAAGGEGNSPFLWGGIACAAVIAIVVAFFLFRSTGKPPIAKAIEVPGNQAWVPTGIYLNQGAAIAISATGSVSMGAGWTPLPPSGKTQPYAPLATGNGQSAGPKPCGGGFPAPYAPCWTLIGRVSDRGAPFYVGDEATLRAPAAGQLFLGVNDDQLGDNSGSWTATVTVTSGLAAAPLPSSSGKDVPPVPLKSPPAPSEQPQLAGNAPAPGTAPTPPVVPGGQRPAATLQASVLDGQTSIEFPSGNYYIYGMVTGGGAPSASFTITPDTKVVDAGGVISAALSWGNHFQNNFTTNTAYHVIGGVSVSGSWSDIEPYYQSNSQPGASNASVFFPVLGNSLVVVVALASSQQSVKLAGIPGLQVDASSSGPGASEGMVIAHTYLSPGNYTVTERSAALSAGQNPAHMADLIGVYVFRGAGQ